ncbi:MAG: hypothetical protein JEZ11_08895 [Desulfobacterales bacterium]|nr:hypothetical protein [Desulfobacterales bacterium]
MPVCRVRPGNAPERRLSGNARPAHAELLETCLDDSVEVSAEPFIELLKADPGNDPGLWERQRLCLGLAARLDANAVSKLRSTIETILLMPFVSGLQRTRLPGDPI